MTDVLALPTRQRLLAIARHLMMTKGYNATTIEEICALGQVTKGAFFHYFKTKEALGEQVLKDYWALRSSQFGSVPWFDAPTPRLQLSQFLAVVAQVFMADPDGFTCLAGSFTQELASVHPAFQEKVAGLFEVWGAQIKPVLHAAKQQAAHPDAVDVDLLADHIIAVVEGALILALARQDAGVITAQLRVLDAHLQLILRP